MPPPFAPDGLAARPVSEWNDRKYHYLRRYMQIFATGMRNRWRERAYVDLFAGPGVVRNEETGAFEDGSPLVAMARDFTSFVFVEKDPESAEALRRRVAAHPRGSLAHVLEGDCNDVVREVRRRLPAGSRSLTFAFIDPTAWQIRYDTLAQLVHERRVDLLVTFQVGFMKRNADRDQPLLDAFFGTPEWRPHLGVVPRAWELLGVYRAQLAKLEYIVREDIPVIPVTNSTNSLMYFLVFFSKHPKGYDFWNKIAGVDERGQLRLAQPGPPPE